MKNIRKILTVFLLVVSMMGLVACGAKVEKNDGYKLLKTMEMKKEGVSVVISYYGEGDMAYKQTTRSEVVYKAIPGVGTKEVAESNLKPIMEKYNGVKGLTHSAEFKEDKLIENIEVDYKELDFEKAKSLPGMMFDGDPKNGVSVSKSVELLKQGGFTEKK